MREIKFRVWDNASNQMLYIGRELDEHIGGKPAHLMQFTGLKDKEGTDIYEGDIVTSEAYPYQDEGEYNYHGVIEWEDELAAFLSIYCLVNPEKSGISDGIGNPLDNVDELVVIGNIYANPELLKKTEEESS